jgi:hypothetical protein
MAASPPPKQHCVHRRQSMDTPAVQDAQTRILVRPAPSLDAGSSDVHRAMPQESLLDSIPTPSSAWNRHRDYAGR